MQPLHRIEANSDNHQACLLNHPLQLPNLHLQLQKSHPHRRRRREQDHHPNPRLTNLTTYSQTMAPSWRDSNPWNKDRLEQINRMESWKWIRLYRGELWQNEKPIDIICKWIRKSHSSSRLKGQWILAQLGSRLNNAQSFIIDKLWCVHFESFFSFSLIYPASLLLLVCLMLSLALNPLLRRHATDSMYYFSVFFSLYQEKSNGRPYRKSSWRRLLSSPFLSSFNPSSEFKLFRFLLLFRKQRNRGKRLQSPGQEEGDEDSTTSKKRRKDGDEDDDETDVYLREVRKLERSTLKDSGSGVRSLVK